ncbi:SelL-related redox protein [Porifericola rhodea]|uniref:SelL-related redox protein n=1 Tax=Porifericola rhodea TaxID=930972 RepID=UPI002666E681|nr:SelL-related redox protein [Porifericola rhodea]WKN33237.1 SelL-related redox protein [Porifericola rhodea]
MRNLPDWIAIVLRFAGITNAVWGLTFALFTDIMLRWAGMSTPFSIFPWLSIGLMAITFGAAYFLAAANPLRHTLIIITGFFIKLSSFIFLLKFYLSDQVTARLAFFFALKDIIWIPVLGIIIYQIFKAWQAPNDEEYNPQHPLNDTLRHFRTEEGKSLYELSMQKPVYLMFLRHFGCTFCREALSDLKQYRREIEAQGMSIVLVHMSSSEEATLFFDKYKLNSIHQISDSECVLYRTFQLNRGSFRQLFGIRAWVRGLQAGIIRTQGIGVLAGDGFRMPGIFVIYKGEILKSYRHRHAADRPDYLALADCELA